MLKFLTEKYKARKSLKFLASSSKYHKTFKDLWHEVIKKSELNSERVCFFAHFDPEGVISDSVVNFLSELKRCKFNIIFCSTSELLKSNQNEIDKIRELCSYIIIRENIGIDFGSWHTCYQLIKDQLNDVQYILLTNDSIIGPIYHLDQLLDDLSKTKSYAGLTQTDFPKKHLQSYFLLFCRDVFTSLSWQEFIQEFKYYYSKERVILEYELSLSDKIAFQPDLSKYTYNSLAKRFPHKAIMTQNEFGNPSLQFWEELVDLGFPFVKKSLFNSPHASKVKTVINKKGKL